MRTCRTCGRPIGNHVTCGVCGASNPLSINWGPPAFIVILLAGIAWMLLSR